MNEIYMCYLNGSFYGSGSLEYIKELFVDYVITCEMYGKDKCSFEIVKKKRNQIQKSLEELGKMEYSDYKPEETYEYYENMKANLTKILENNNASERKLSTVRLEFTSYCEKVYKMTTREFIDFFELNDCEGNNEQNRWYRQAKILEKEGYIFS